MPKDKWGREVRHETRTVKELMEIEAYASPYIEELVKISKKLWGKKFNKLYKSELAPLIIPIWDIEELALGVQYALKKGQKDWVIFLLQRLKDTLEKAIEGGAEIGYDIYA